MKNRLVNIALVFLLAIAFYQTYRLWFINLSNNSSNQNQIIVNSNIKEDLVKPFRLSVQIDDNTFNSYYNVDDLSLYTDGKKLFKSILRNGTNVNSFDNSDYTDLVVFNYNFVFEEEYFKESLSENKSKVHLNSFDNIFIYFTKDENYANFYDSQTDTSTFVSFDDRSYLPTVAKYKDPRDFYTVSDDLIHFTEKWDNDLEYNQITHTNPYSLNGEIHISSVERMINGFFQNPLSKTQSIQNETNAITFSDNNTIVRYYPNNIFEYKYYYIYDDQKKNDFVESFTLAKNFILNDIAIDNNFYLDKYEISGDEITFYFNYSIGDFPILLSENFKKEKNISSAIEITVQNNTVVNYRKIPYNFQLSTRTYKGNLTYDNATKDMDDTTNSILAYKMDDTPPLRLFWFLYYDNSEFTMPFSYN